MVTAKLIGERSSALCNSLVGSLEHNRPKKFVTPEWTGKTPSCVKNGCNWISR